ncbi:RNase H family protein [Loigolactobacillus jiayinensis]|uniref:RNase H family protein n=1 Tax=Loigolactobacillus jiayinensis TaxID=2486016 RepID=A0ABW1RGR6_9LACO|nr:RNase H family protein [Loigolactobacillus jiayinensis]
MTNIIKIYTDGSYSPTAQTGGWAYMINDDEGFYSKCELRRESGRQKDPIFFEIKAIAKALEAVPTTKIKVIVYTDSIQAVNFAHGLDGGGNEKMPDNQWAKENFERTVANIKKLKRQLDRIQNVEVVKTRGHIGLNTKIHNKLYKFLYGKRSKH